MPLNIDNYENGTSFNSAQRSNCFKTFADDASTRVLVLHGDSARLDEEGHPEVICVTEFTSFENALAYAAEITLAAMTVFPLDAARVAELARSEALRRAQAPCP